MTTRVDRLQLEINQIQGKCLHVWTITTIPPVLVPSLEPDYFIGEVNGLVRLPGSPVGNNHYSIKCVRCSLKKDTRAHRTCSICFARMSKGEWAEDHTNRKRYFGIDDASFYGIMETHCTQDSTHPKFIYDEWDR